MDRRKPVDAPSYAAAHTAVRRIAKQIARLSASEEMTDRIARAVPAISAGVDVVADGLLALAASGGRLRRSFLFCVALPTLLFFLYSALLQSPRYVCETKLAVREAQKKENAKVGDAASIMARMSGGVGGGRDAQNSTMVLNYIKSQAILHDLGGRAFMEAKFSRADVDYFSRLRMGSDIEDLARYWLAHLSASVENLSGILTFKIDAFSPVDARDIATDVLRLSEDLINKITLRNRGDALARAADEVTLARQKLAAARERVLDFRNRNFLIDPGARATSIGEVISKLTLERVELVNALSVSSSSLDLDAPSQRLQRTRLAAIDRQLVELRKKLTDEQGGDAVSAQIAAFENLKLEEQFAERLYAIAQSGYENARQDLERQQLYLVTVVRPTLPESAFFPRVAANTILLFFALLVSWAIVSLVVASIEDQMM